MYRVELKENGERWRRRVGGEGDIAVGVGVGA